MAKFLKSIFTSSSERKKNREIELEEDRDFTPPLDGRRKLSISRSGRMKQNNKKRHELNLELYGEITHPVEKLNHLEYHVNKITPERAIYPIQETNRRSIDIDTNLAVRKEPLIHQSEQNMPIELRVKTPEEEIDSAFEIIDKAL